MSAISWSRLRPAARWPRASHTAASLAPAPFLVGVPRSGTTLLRLMLDAHPALAIPPETGFGVLLTNPAVVAGGPVELLGAVTSLPTWPDLGFERDQLLARLRRVRPWSAADGVRTIFTAYAQRHGKPRWGDKTPVHVRHMSTIARHLPEAHFVNIVRDGRDVAASVRDLPISPGGIEAIALDWRDQIRDARVQAVSLSHYREVRYEQLVADPEAVLRELCACLALDFDPAMLRAHERAAERHREMPERLLPDGTWITHEGRNRWHGLTLHPPDPSRVGRWHDALTPEEITCFEAAAGPLLHELGYALSVDA